MVTFQWAEGIHLLWWRQNEIRTQQAAALGRQPSGSHALLEGVMGCALSAPSAYMVPEGQ